MLHNAFDDEKNPSLPKPFFSLQFDESIQALIFNGTKCSTYTCRRNSDGVAAYEKDKAEGTRPEKL